MDGADSAPLFELFWENSKLTPSNVQEFAARINEYYGVEHSADSLQRAGRDHKLPLPSDALFRTMLHRRSVRLWSDRRVSFGQLGSLFAAFARRGDDGRVFPSAGATYALEVYGFLNQVQGDLAGKIVYYNSDNHSLAVVGDVPPDDQYRRLINLDPEGPIPPLLFAFLIFADRTTAKYGERGGRFALLEVGQAVQNLALRLVHEGMVGVEVGGLLDDQILALLGLKGRAGAKTVIGFACGLAATR